MIFPATLIPAGSLVYIAVFVDSPVARPLAWSAWIVGSVLLISALIIIWRLEERNAISERAKRGARLAMAGCGFVFAAAALAAILWPSAPVRLRVHGGVLLSSLLVGWHYLRPMLKP